MTDETGEGMMRKEVRERKEEEEEEWKKKIE